LKAHSLNSPRKLSLTITGRPIRLIGSVTNTSRKGESDNDR